MGGFGSGRNNGRPCTDDMRSIDVRRIKREGCLRVGRSYNWGWHGHGNVLGSIQYSVRANRVRFDYRYRSWPGQWVDVRVDALLEHRACHFGGTRVWWRCPHCDRRVAIFYLGHTVACRQCWGLAYRVERESHPDRATRRADTIRRRLRWMPGILNGHWSKPKGMHWRTFKRLCAEHDRNADIAVSAFMAKYSELDPELRHWLP